MAILHLTFVFAKYFYVHIQTCILHITTNGYLTDFMLSDPAFVAQHDFCLCTHPPADVHCCFGVPDFLEVGFNLPKTKTSMVYVPMQALSHPSLKNLNHLTLK